MLCKTATIAQDGDQRSRQVPMRSDTEDTRAGTTDFVPPVPTSLAAANIEHSQIEALVLKFLVHQREATGHQLAARLALPFAIIEESLHRLKADLLVIFKAAAPLGDYVYEISQRGHDRAQHHFAQCAYVGPAPVPLDQYSASVQAQSVCKQKPRFSDIRRALGDLTIDDQLVCQLGEAVHSGLGFFLYGAPGNGKTSIAERITQAYGKTIWIPYAIDVGGEIVQLFDPHSHRPAGANKAAGQDAATPHDQRWVRIERPTIVGGGELTLSSLEITRNPTTGVSEAPLQMKSNCGTLVIDDFGRQRVSLSEMLNRWIVPLERRYDYLGAGTGRKIEVPFDQLVIFSSNLDPTTLVDEAFLRRVPYKIQVRDPNERQFRQLCAQLAVEMGIACDDAAMNYLVASSAAHGRRFCHPQALLRQIANFCDFRQRPRAVTQPAVDAAVKNYFVAQTA